MQIVEKPVRESVNPAVQLKLLSVFPGVLHETGFFDMTGLIENVELAKEVFFPLLA